LKIPCLYIVLINSLCALTKPANNGNQANLGNVGGCYIPLWAETGCILFANTKYRNRWRDCNFDCFNEPDYLCMQACAYEKACGCYDLKYD
jgi:hypothetical protein